VNAIVAVGAPAMITVTATAAAGNATATARVVVRGEPGTIDTSVGQGGVAFTRGGAYVHGLSPQPDGKTLVAGYVVPSGAGSARGWIGRFDATYSLDTTFATTGYTTLDFGSGTDETLFGSALQSDGKLVVAGFSSNSMFMGNAIMARVDSAGALDPTFASGGKLTTSFPGATQPRLYAPFVQRDGAIIGYGDMSDGMAFHWALLRLNPQGALDTLFGSGGKIVGPIGGGVRCVGQQADGKLQLAGSVYDSNVRKWAATRIALADGSTDTTYGTGGTTITSPPGNNIVTACTMDASERMVVAGATLGGNATNFYLARFDAHGLDPTFGGGQVVTTALGTSSGNTGAPQVVLVAPDGKIVLVGPSPLGAITVLRYAADGTLDPTFASSGELGTDQTISNPQGANAMIDSLRRIVIVGTAVRGTTWGIFFLRVWL
jgi:uncharacterized delta-60 repeat protein